MVSPMMFFEGRLSASLPGFSFATESLVEVKKMSQVKTAFVVSLNELV